MEYRIFVEKKSRFQVEADSLKKELNENLSLNIKELHYLNVYDLFGFTEELLEKCKYTVFGETVTDNVYVDGQDEYTSSILGHPFLSVEFLPGQFDQRASSAVDCVHLIDPNADIDIRSSRLLVFDDAVSEEDIQAVRHYYINAVESREKDLCVLSNKLDVDIKPLADMDGFIDMQPSDYDGFCKKWGLAMNADDLNEVVQYFRKEGRNPTETELRILDTYWSDHCRHTTFTTELQQITIDESFMKAEMQESLDLFYKIRKELGREHKPLCLMELATIGARYLRKTGHLDDMEQSEENNACSIFINVDVDGKDEKWLLQFKNETHNHPTEIEPLGGASTCLGGAIRDPLSGRAYVYQAMRVTGAGDITKPVSETITGKLPQKVISRKAAQGYSSYGNQIGLATTHVREIFHPGYTAKRLEVGAVVGAVKAENVRRESPASGDVILLLGGRTGRDGIGGATGSSKEHTEESLETCGSEVQKGNAPEERKIQRLFRRPEVTRLIKKSNDFGAGGVSVAIGELADGLDIYLDRVPTKYSGLNPTELAISESQERMAVVVEAKDQKEFESYCRRDNIEVTHVADVTDSARMKMFYHGTLIADITREFIDSAGARHFAEAQILPVGDFKLNTPLPIPQDQGMIEMFDSTIGRSTVLMPFGGKYQKTPAQVSVQKLPVDGFTNTASIMAYGFDPYLCEWSPYHGAAYSVVEACTKVVTAGADWSNMRFSYQEYFERMTSDPHSWGKPLSALLGALKMQVELQLPSIGGKDSMSGTFEDISVPPTLVAFGITTINTRDVISPELKTPGNNLYLIRHTPLDNYMPDVAQLKSNWNYVHEQILAGNIVSAYSLEAGGVKDALAKMKAGNGLDAECVPFEEPSLPFGSILVESTTELDFPQAVLIGKVKAETAALANAETVALTKAAPSVLSEGKRPVAYIPVFPGTNCDYDTAKAFRTAGAEVRTTVFRNLTSEDVFESIEEMKQNIDNCQILAFSGGFSAGDEPDGSGKFIANVINNKTIADSIHALLDRGGLILGICNGFQALVKSGLLPYGRLGMVTTESPTLFRNDVNRHISMMTTTKVATVDSPWLNSFSLGEEHTIAISHGEGKFVVSDELARQLFDNHQVAFQYTDNPNGSSFDIEGIISPDGHILGKMGHSERYEDGLFKNISGNLRQSIFENAVNYFRN